MTGIKSPLLWNHSNIIVQAWLGQIDTQTVSSISKREPRLVIIARANGPVFCGSRPQADTMLATQLFVD